MLRIGTGEVLALDLAGSGLAPDDLVGVLAIFTAMDGHGKYIIYVAEVVDSSYKAFISSSILEMKLLMRPALRFASR